ncbi:type II toxin-antitoxin system RelE/ParE family toxin [Geomonas sp. RF6]|uniref:type II toxin-antitoxin system RelE family toxin n=1 Tax=Geomonas sp. RF6 TaxID=2897342 RepID=UPI001E512CB8|nr:type II toxin-antitoxin system RelE/ParE family toxin [Geomonas sp. RF6]UFS68594.1 type II toxin-antitoxin system RelE/ParE family toxin [Geomonas sp. RF6]
MSWKIEFSPAAKRELDRLDRPIARRILNFLSERVSKLDDPRAMGAALKGPHLGEFWKYRIGDYRIIAKIEDSQLLILVLRVGNRRDIYER